MTSYDKFDNPLVREITTYTNVVSSFLLSSLQCDIYVVDVEESYQNKRIYPL